MRLKALLDSAYRRTSELYFNELESGDIELIWLRAYGDRLSSVHRRVVPSLRVGLIQLLAEEDAFRHSQEHSAGCPCDDCCIERVDLERNPRNERL